MDLERRASNPQIVVFALFAAMAAVRGPRRTPEGQRIPNRRIFRNSWRRRRKWRETGPDFAHPELGLAAAAASSRGKLRVALSRYAKACDRAVQLGDRAHPAYLFELRAELLRATRRTTEAKAMPQQALAHYEAWGCAFKVSELNLRLEARPVT